MADYTSLQKLAQEATEKGVSISDIVIEDQSALLEIEKEQLMAQMSESLDVMEQSARNGANKDLRSYSGLTGGDGYKMLQHVGTKTLSGNYTAMAMSVAISVAEYNASMGKIVASPTAGSCGVIPGAILPLLWEERIEREDALRALLCAGGIGLVIANCASIAGAEGGCQAECGSAASMAAAALVELMGGTPDMAIHAVAIAIKNQLGLVCDPVAGLVEIPCIKRNAGSVMCAITAAEMALSGIKSTIPADEVLQAMREVGDSMPVTMKETAKGGLAATKTGKEMMRKIFARDISEEEN